MKPLVTILLLSCSLLSPGPGRAEDPPAEAPVAATVDADGVQRLTMVLDNYFYRPKHIVVAVDKPVELTLVSESGFAPHNIVIDDPASGLDIRKDVGSGKTVKLSFTPKRTGTFVFFCDKKAPFMASHRAKGMEGVIEVR